MNARNAILARLRGATVAEQPALPDVAAWFEQRRRSENLSERCTRLRQALEAVHTQVFDVTQANWADVLLALLAQKGLGQLLIGKDTPHGQQLLGRPTPGLQLMCYEQPIEQWQDLLFDGVAASLTLARSAIAETGSLVLWPKPSEPRLMSLVPAVHIVLLDASTIHADLHAVMLAEQWAAGMPTNALLICGPSKTADIQQTLAYGAHGPKELLVLLRHAQGSQA